MGEVNSLDWIGLDLVTLIVTFVSVFMAGIIRGYSGFGFAMVADIVRKNRD